MCEWADAALPSEVGIRDMRYAERREWREVIVFKVVRCVEVPVSSATMTLVRSTAPVGGVLTSSGSKGGGDGADMMFVGKQGNGG
jgi:hypothetical protein